MSARTVSPVNSNEMLHELARVLRYPRLQAFYDLTENLVFDYVNFLHQAAELVELNPLVASPIRDVNDIIVMQTAIIGEADILCTKDSDFFEDPAREYLSKLGIVVLDDISLIHRLRS
jgi:putative PIN family toxin of toxin-antitoxin system